MKKQNKDMYDVVIIGAGIGGLVCGCYLAKAGMKVLIVEQHYKPGGYCTSFKRQGFTFDAAAHSFGGYRENGIVRRVFTDLGIDKQIKIQRYDPSDIIITPDYKVSFWADMDKTIREFQNTFPDEHKNIKKFFYFLTNPDPKSFARIRSWTFKDLLDKYFKNDKLKAILSFPLYGNGGLPPSLMSAFIGAKLFFEFLLDGGYYPKGGMQRLPDVLVNRFKELGGELRLSCTVKKIRVKDDGVKGIDLEEGDFISSKYVVSNCDARQTFIKLLGRKIVNKEFLDKLNNMIPSLSMFVLYLGIDNYFKTLPQPGSNVWFLPYYDIEDMYEAAKNRSASNLAEYMVRTSPDRKTVLAFSTAFFKNKKYWLHNKNALLDSLIKRIEKHTITNLSKHLKYTGAATPYTLYKYTFNYKGAAYGWASMPSQIADPDLRRPSFVHGLYLTGHWTTQGMGIPGVAYLSYDLANLLIRKERMSTNN